MSIYAVHPCRADCPSTTYKQHQLIHTKQATSLFSLFVLCATNKLCRHIFYLAIFFLLITSNMVLLFFLGKPTWFYLIQYSTIKIQKWRYKGMITPLSTNPWVGACPQIQHVIGLHSMLSQIRNYMRFLNVWECQNLMNGKMRGSSPYMFFFYRRSSPYMLKWRIQPAY